MPISAVLVEDNLTIRDTLIPALADLAQVEVVGVADTADDAVSELHARGGGWQLAVVDLFLRKGSGLEVLKAVRDRGDNQRVVVLTNYATDDMKIRCKALGADEIFDKSTELDAFFDYCMTNLNVA